MYDYLKNVKEDVKEYIRNEVVEEVEKIDTNELYNILFLKDSVTGNASGSYTFNTYQAEENLCHNLDLLKEALEEFGETVGKTVGEAVGEAIEKGAEYCDVTIRCYLLGEAIREAIEELKEEVLNNEE